MRRMTPFSVSARTLARVSASISTQPVRYNQNSFSGYKLIDRLLNKDLILRIKRGRGFIKYHNRRIFKQGSGY